MAAIESLFVTRVYRAEVDGIDPTTVARACRAIAAEDKAGRAWSKAKCYKGYTSYGSLTDLADRAPEFGDLKRIIDRHVAGYAEAARFDLGRRKLKLDNIWINILAPGGVHTSHIHPHSVVSGTFYAAVPAGASSIQFEDPRLGLMMAAPPRREDAEIDSRAFVSFAPKPGSVMLWESWLRHEVPMNQAAQDRISVSFNYRWG